MDNEIPGDNNPTVTLRILVQDTKFRGDVFVSNIPVNIERLFWVWLEANPLTITYIYSDGTTEDFVPDDVYGNIRDKKNIMKVVLS